MNPQSSSNPNRAAFANPNDNSLYVFRTFYTYEADTLAQYPNGLAAGASANLTFNIAKDSDFFWTKFGVLATVGGVGTTVSAEELPYINMTMINATNGRQYMNNPVPLPNMSGSGRLPFILPVATLWEALTTIQITLQNVGDDDYSNVQLSFLGIKAFLKPQSP
jgi:hypothetical protein